ncbi:MAG: hypothetical protein ACJ8AW_04395 [Rhodopila sp.]
MASSAAESWSQRIVAIRDALLTLEINTVVGDEISAQKMPEVPLALHSLVRCYSRYLGLCGYQVTANLLATSISRAGGLGESSTAEGANRVLRRLEFWPFPGRVLTNAEILAFRNGDGLLKEDKSDPVTELTNGVETFEALQWAAWWALQHAYAERQQGGTDPTRDTAILNRIYANCRQVKEAAMRPEQIDRGVPEVAKRLREALSPELAAAKLAEPTRRQLFGATVEETARSLFVSPGRSSGRIRT